MNIYVTRHGQRMDYHKFEGPTGYHPLTELGRQQARKLAKRLDGEGFSGRIYSSPFSRCLETADVICEELGMEFHPEPQITEKCGNWIDSFTGLKGEEMIDQFEHCHEDAAHISWPWWPTEPESYDEVAERMRPFSEALLEDLDEDLLLVGHGATSWAAVYTITGVDTDGHYNAGLSTIDASGTPTLQYQNDTSHLGPGEITSNEKVIE